MSSFDLLVALNIWPIVKTIQQVHTARSELAFDLLVNVQGFVASVRPNAVLHGVNAQEHTHAQEHIHITKEEGRARKCSVLQLRIVAHADTHFLGAWWLADSGSTDARKCQ